MKCPSDGGSHNWVWLRQVKNEIPPDPDRPLRDREWDIFYCSKCLEKKGVPS